jgi:hypothetical protein
MAIPAHQERRMDFIAALWIPIIASAAAIWFASFLIWAVLPIHRKDFDRLPDEDAFVQAIRDLGLTPGNYIFPHAASRAQEKDPAYIQRMKEGHVGLLSLWGRVNMGRNMLLSFLAYLAASFLIAYLGWVALQPGADFMHVFRVLGTAGVLAHGFGFIAHDVWFGAYGRSILLKFVDGIIYGLLTGLIFAALWPAP